MVLRGHPELREDAAARTRLRRFLRRHGVDEAHLPPVVPRRAPRRREALRDDRRARHADVRRHDGERMVPRVALALGLSARPQAHGRPAQVQEARQGQSVLQPSRVRREARHARTPLVQGLDAGPRTLDAVVHRLSAGTRHLAQHVGERRKGRDRDLSRGQQAVVLRAPERAVLLRHLRLRETALRRAHEGEVRHDREPQLRLGEQRLREAQVQGLRRASGRLRKPRQANRLSRRVREVHGGPVRVPAGRGHRAHQEARPGREDHVPAVHDPHVGHRPLPVLPEPGRRLLPDWRTRRHAGGAPARACGRKADRRQRDVHRQHDEFDPRLLPRAVHPRLQRLLFVQVGVWQVGLLLHEPRQRPARRAPRLAHREARRHGRERVLHAPPARRAARGGDPLLESHRARRRIRPRRLQVLRPGAVRRRVRAPRARRHLRRPDHQHDGAPRQLQGARLRRNARVLPRHLHADQEVGRERRLARPRQHAP